MTERHPIVSVIIPTYNHGHLIGRALESVLSQSFQDFEIIVVDNHSTDNTDLVLASYACSRLTVLRFTTSDLLLTHEIMEFLPRGDWIAFDSDDWWMPQKLQSVLAISLIRSNLSSSHFVWFIFSIIFSFLFRYLALKSPILTHLLKSGNPYFLCSSSAYDV